MINIKQLKSLKGLSASNLPKIERLVVCPDREDYLKGAPRFYPIICKAFDYNYNIVYVLWIGADIVYIGQSRFITQRLQSHKSRIKYTHVSLINLPDKQTMDDIEIRLIQKHRPIFNKRHNPDYGYAILS